MNENQEKAAKLLYLIWHQIDFDSMSRTRLMGIWDEFLGKVKSASYSPTGEDFIEQLSRKMGISALKDTAILELISPDVLQEIREHTRAVILLTRGIVEEHKKQYKLNEERKASRQKAQALLEESDKDFEELLKETKGEKEDD